jgi:hypothetical protein
LVFSCFASVGNCETWQLEGGPNKIVSACCMDMKHHKNLCISFSKKKNIQQFEKIENNDKIEGILQYLYIPNVK